MILLGLSVKLPQISILTEHNKDGVAPSPTGKVPKIRSLLSVAACVSSLNDAYLKTFSDVFFVQIDGAL
jgi:hypothetical protein